MRALGLLVGVVLAASAARAQEPARFVPLDLYVDVGAAEIAAYQIEITVTQGAGAVVGVEGGGGVFAEAPYYDPAALARGRIVVAAFTLSPSPPSGRVRVATLHMQERGAVRYALKTLVVAGPSGERLAARVTLEPREKR